MHGKILSCFKTKIVIFISIFLLSCSDSPQVANCISACENEKSLTRMGKFVSYDPVSICKSQCRKTGGECRAKDGSGGPYTGCFLCGASGGQLCDGSRKEAADTSGEGGLVCGLCMIAIIIAIVVGFISREEKRKKQEAARTKQAEDKQGQKALLAARLVKAASLGFSVDNETKECPACAETIKLKANTCRYCRKEFSDEEVDKVTQGKIDTFLADHESA